MGVNLIKSIYIKSNPLSTVFSSISTITSVKHSCEYSLHTIYQNMTITISTICDTCLFQVTRTPNRYTACLPRSAENSVGKQDTTDAAVTLSGQFRPGGY